MQVTLAEIAPFGARRPLVATAVLFAHDVFLVAEDSTTPSIFRDVVYFCLIVPIVQVVVLI